MCILMEIQEDVNEIAKAIASALRVDVEIVNTNLIRVAVVGKLQHMRGEKLFTYGHSYRRAFKTGQKYIIDSPGESQLCGDCEWFGKCIYKAAVYAPIKGEEEVVGVISLTAFNDEQKAILMSNLGANLYFVERMANLIYSKVREKRMLKDMIVMTDKLNQVINFVDRGIIATDKKGLITHINQSGLDKLKLTGSEDIIKKSINDIFPLLQYRDFIDGKAQGMERQEICSSICEDKEKYVVTMKKISYNNEPEGMVISFDNYSRVKGLAYNLVNRDKPISMNDIIGDSKEIKQFKERVLRVSQSNSTVLLIGETGTGKEVFARAIHNHSQRCDKPFVIINCSAIPDSLIESELFGYEKGAFTGANKLGKPGKFEIANGGTIFLDEIEAMPIHMQPKILRVLQEKEVIRVGSNENIPIDVRIISATNENLEELVDRGEFRADLYHRLNVIPAVIPPLRERGYDIILLANYFVDRFSKAMGNSIKGIDNEVEKLLMRYSWPGNVRELQNVIEYAVNLEDGENITVSSLPQNCRNLLSDSNRKNDVNTLEEVERKEIVTALNKYGWDESGRILAARELGISRATIYRKIKKMGIENKDRIKA